jgi:predicted dehydrogenase
MKNSLTRRTFLASGAAALASATVGARVEDARPLPNIAPHWYAARELVQAGVIGRVRWCAASGRPASALTFPHGPAAQCIHDLWTGCAYVTGASRPLSVSALGGASDGGDVPDALAVSAAFAGGLHFSLDCNPARNEPETATFRGDRGSLVVDRDRIRVMPEAPWDAELHEVWRNERPYAFPRSVWERDEMGAAREAAAGVARAMDAYRVASVA